MIASPLTCPTFSIHYNKASTAANPPKSSTPAAILFPTFAVVVPAVELVVLVVLELSAVLEDAAVVVVDTSVAEEVPDDEEEVEVEMELEDKQETASGTVTPAVLQMFWAYVTDVAWSAASQAEARQHAISDRKVGLEQMHLTSRLAHPPISVPVVNWVTQDSAHDGRD